MERKAPQLAKLTRPRLHKAVARERLFELLDEKRTNTSPGGTRNASQFSDRTGRGSIEDMPSWC